MARTDYKLIATFSGEYGIYEIRVNYRTFWNEYYIYKNMEFWKSASSPEGATRLILDYDPSAVSI